jgi:hypothetical protein
MKMDDKSLLGSRPKEEEVELGVEEEEPEPLLWPLL